MSGRGPTDPSEAHFDKGLWGWDLSQWRKLSQLWGYTDRWFANLDTTATDTYVLERTGVVPPGYVYVLEAAALLLFDRATTSAAVEIRIEGTAGCPVVEAATLAANTWLVWAGRATLKAGDQVQLYLNGCQVDDTFRGRVWGYKMAVAQ